jgi:hypothetical protein
MAESETVARFKVENFNFGFPDSPEATWRMDGDGVPMLFVTLPSAWQVELLLRFIPGEKNAAKFFALPAGADSFGSQALQDENIRR